MNAQTKAARALFRPKRPEMKVACASCPFARDNYNEFKAICDRLSVADGEGPVKPSQVNAARHRIKMETAQMGDFSCHNSVYDENMNVKSPSEWRQCPNATKWFKGELQ